MKAEKKAWMGRVKAFWNQRQLRAVPGALTGYLLDESPPSIGKRRFEGEWGELKGWLEGRDWSGLRALDLGCGTGAWLRVLAPRFASVEGWDIAPAMIQASRKTLASAGIKNATLKCGQLGSRKGEAQFDFILVAGLLMYLPDGELARVLKSVARLARPGALIVFRESCSGGASWSREGLALRSGIGKGGASRQDYVAIYRSKAELVRKLGDAGLRVFEERPNRHYKFSDLTEDWLRRLDRLSAGKIAASPELAESAAAWIYRARLLLLYPEYFWRMTLGLKRWKIENYWLIASST